MSEEKNSYQQIMKATSLFGGVQVFNIITTIIRSKIIAVLLGPLGIGITSLLTSTTGLVSMLTNFSLRTSAIKDIAVAQVSDNNIRISKVVIVFRRLVWITGLLGLITTLILSPWLSQLTFGNKEYTIAFMWLSITLLFNQLSSGQNVLLQGMRKLNYLAKANMIGSIIGLLVSLPIYYYWRLDGIVPALILIAISTFLVVWYFARKVKIEKVEVTKQQTIFEGKGMLRMGFMLSLSGLITLGASYIVRIFISNTGGIEDVGLYSAGFAIIGTYVSLVFSAMGTDFYPRLSGVAHDNKKATLLINQQAEIGILILAPILTVFLIFINLIIILLYSTKFIPINGMIHWAALGMYFKVASWSISFILLAKGDSKLFFWNELIANFYMLGLNIGGYYFYGLDGLGISFMISYILYLIQVFLLAKHKYSFLFDVEFYKIFGVQFMIGFLCFVIVKITPTLWAYILGVFFILLSIWYSFYELDKRLDLKGIINNFRKK